MFAEKTELKLVDDLNETALVELNAAEVDDVSGGFLPLVFAAGFVAGYVVAKNT
ncbi:class IIb bacteriocin, lactobin A/cerein 7B family [Paracoccus sp. S3-43]|uniref:class IIb bacteriocin, lactobin A/cerein 7B family n=1 Tax=Paracoccus sp. S3-43 TaxID=3030011 RepID=UPI0023AF0C5B|nr:class IIb bacteriocin, lactobin A/cerein 7B family [Paracoccus sp. S3-43]WEF25818.1 class IIb bacteriocin, lactobin A/cerein 7B family [Paracoccus sp. S3-43]